MTMATEWRSFSPVPEYSNSPSTTLAGLTNFFASPGMSAAATTVLVPQ